MVLVRFLFVLHYIKKTCSSRHTLQMIMGRQLIQKQMKLKSICKILATRCLYLDDFTCVRVSKRAGNAIRSGTGDQRGSGSVLQKGGHHWRPGQGTALCSLAQCSFQMSNLGNFCILVNVGRGLDHLYSNNASISQFRTQIFSVLSELYENPMQTPPRCIIELTGSCGMINRTALAHNSHYKFTA